MSDCSRSERQAVFIARQIKDGEQVVAGTNLEVPRAALLLAHWHHAPNLRVQLGGYMANLFDAERVERFAARADFDRKGVPGVESYVPLDFENLWRVNLTFIGGMQVDIGNGDTSAPADEYRMQQGQGQATVTGAEISGNDYYDMQSMNIWLDDGTNFSWIELSLFGEPTGADLHFVLTDNNGDTFDFYGEILNGETKFAFEAVDGQLISNLFWEVTDGAVTTVKQIRIDPGVAGPTVPEPSTWAMMLMGFGFAGVAMRRRRRDNGLAQLA